MKKMMLVLAVCLATSQLIAQKSEKTPPPPTPPIPPVTVVDPPPPPPLEIESVLAEIKQTDIPVPPPPPPPPEKIKATKGSKTAKEAVRFTAPRIKKDS